ATTDYGTRRDAMTLWYSFARYRGSNPEAARHFDCVVDPRDPTDMTRAMISSRRRGPARGADDFPQYYLTPRESRHVRGGHTVTVADILSRRRFEDVVLICKANFDIKGIADGDLYLSGYIEPGYVENHSVQIPYRALRPGELENILVVGKAYSATHDALGLARMQRDLMAMGGAAGLAAARAARNDEALSAIDVKALQKALVALGVLSQADLQAVRGVKDSELPELNEGELRRMIDRLAGGRLDLEGEVGVLTRPKRSIPLLREALAKAGGKGKLAVARALCFLADPGGADVLLAEIDRQLQAAGLPPKPFRMHHASPDHGYAPEICFLINSLGRLGDARVIPHMTEVARRVKMDPAKSDVMFDYVFSVCHAAERLGDPACVEALTILADKPCIRGSVLPRRTDPRKTASRQADRYAYLELCAGRALARCGARRGYDIVLDYLRDARGFLARSAHEELVALSGRDLGYDGNAWRSWLSSAELSPRPYRQGPRAGRSPQ
ncbi:MAG: FAD-dependent oxidoreductase, partial [Phycisphaerae bacterium]